MAAGGVPKHGLEGREDIDDAVVVDNADEPVVARKTELYCSAI